MKCVYWPPSFRGDDSVVGSASGCDRDTTRVQDTIFEKDGFLPIFDKELEFSVSADAK